ncbi:hypothetical protein PFY01_13265 [Brevundimonas vesicularis]|uniref:hypothetical protein n=1 Tax=Brevundimonas vesicularis TaxID=41276 RepID=UPI0022EC5BAA|nr:hypothetical protein [Brevundimonas vesicularis]WBT05674.1 hypothetical protein PFY01_13265 [Brevundimonas vesicularis]
MFMPAYERMSWRRDWLALDDERKRTMDAWGVIFARLERQPGWFDLSEADKNEAERASGLADLDLRLKVIDRRLRRWLRRMPTDLNRDLGAVVENLRIAERLLPSEENTIVHGLIARAARDLVQIGHAQ